MRALDCQAPEAHEETMHFAADSDDELIAKIQQHRDEYHTEVTDDQIKEMVASSAYDE